MLVHQHAHLPAGADEFHRLGETLRAVKQHVTELLTAAQHEVVEERIADGLVDGAGLVTSHIRGGHLREHFPAARVHHEVHTDTERHLTLRFPARRHRKEAASALIDSPCTGIVVGADDDGGHAVIEIGRAHV